MSRPIGSPRICPSLELRGSPCGSAPGNPRPRADVPGARDEPPRAPRRAPSRLTGCLVLARDERSSCLGRLLRLIGQRRVPAPPAMMIACRIGSDDTAPVRAQKPGRAPSPPRHTCELLPGFTRVDRERRLLDPSSISPSISSSSSCSPSRSSPRRVRRPVLVDLRPVIGGAGQFGGARGGGPSAVAAGAVHARCMTSRVSPVAGASSLAPGPPSAGRRRPGPPLGRGVGLRLPLIACHLSRVMMTSRLTVPLCPPRMPASPSSRCETSGPVAMMARRRCSIDTLPRRATR